MTHQQLTFDQLRDRWAAEVPLEFATLLAGLDRTSDAVQRLTGRPPGTFRAFAEREVS